MTVPIRPGPVTAHATGKAPPPGVGARPLRPDRPVTAGETLSAVASGRLRVALQRVARAEGGWSDTDRAPAFHEALARVERHGGLVSAGPAIRALEATGAVAVLDRAMLAEAVALLTADGGLRLAVNFSARTLEDDVWADRLASADPDARRRLILELTETAPLPPGAAARLRRLRALGPALAIDDLGAGRAGIARCVALLPDIIKIDGRLCRRVRADRGARAAVAAGVAMARELEAVTVAEMVESAEIAEALVGLGVDALQGHAIAAPAPAPRVVAAA